MRRYLVHVGLAFVMLAGASGAPLPASGERPLPTTAVRVVSSDRTGVTLEMTVPEVTVEPVTLAGQPYDELAAPGCTPAAEAGRPALPRKTVLLGIPPGADLHVETTALDARTLPGSYHVAPAPQWVAREEAGMSHLEPVHDPDAVVYAAKTPYPAESARILHAGYVRSQRVVSLELTPFRYWPASGELHLIRRLRVRVGFTYPDDAAPSQGMNRAEESSFEGILSRSLLNHESAQSWRATSPPFPSSMRGKEGSQGGEKGWSPPDPAWKVLVPAGHTDLYRLTRADLQAAGVPVGTLDPRTIRLYNQGAEVAIHVAGQEDGHLDQYDVVEFYGQGLDTRYTDTNVYWLTHGITVGLRMTTRNGTPAGAPTPAVFTTTARIEENHAYWSGVPTGDEHWFWERMYAISPTHSVTEPLTATFTGTIGLVATDTLTSSIGILLYGATYNNAVNPDHHALVYLNDHLIADAWWEGQTPYSTTAEVPQAYLTDITNTLRVDMPADTGSSYDGIYVDGFTVQYTHPYHALGDELAFTQDLTGAWEYRVAGFSELDILVFDVTDPAHVVRIIEPPPVTPILAIHKVASPDPVPAGGVLTYTLTVQNHGAITATSVIVTDVVPADTAFRYAQEGALVDGEVRWISQTVRAGDSLALRFSVTVEHPLPQGTVLWNSDYGAWCAEGISVTGEAVTTTVDTMPYRAFLPLVARSYTEPVATSSAASSDSHFLRFQDTVTAPARYLALAVSRAASPLAIVPDVPSHLADPANQASYVMIAHDDFYTRTLPLAAYWQSTGLTTTVARLSDVYDEFAYGIADPTAIRDFLAHAYAHWQPPQLAYVLLVGDGTYDYRNYTGFDAPTKIPPYMVATPYLGETGSDNWYACVSGDDYLPDLHIGRLPAATAVEVDIMVNKVLDYAQSPPSGTWNQDVLFVADNADSAGDFAAYSEALVNSYLPPTYTPHKVYYRITHMNQPAATAAITGTVNDGCLLVNYIGHGAIYLWAHEQLFICYSLRCDFDGLNNHGRLPFVASMTCMDGYYIHPSPAFVSLAERWLLRDAGGAVAAFAADGMGLASGHDYMNRGLFTAIFTDTLPLGPATTASKYFLVGQTGSTYRDLVETYHLFGDPALTLYYHDR